MKPVRVALSASVVVAVVLFAFLVPLPVSRVRQLGLVELVPEKNHKVFVSIPGILEEMKIHDGQQVSQGDVLAVFSSRDVDTDLLDAQTQWAIRQDQLRAVPVELQGTTDPQERKKIELSRATLEGEMAEWSAKVAVYKQMKEALILRAPITGVVMSSPRPNEIGKLWEKGQDTPFCTIGDPRELQCLMPVTPAEMSLLRDDQEWLKAHDKDLGVTLRVQGRDAHTWEGTLEPLPESEAKEIPQQLTFKAGGPIAVKPSARPGSYVPQSQVYLVRVQFKDPDSAVYSGTLAQVKIHCRYRTVAWWVYRTVAGVFDVRLI